jgi:hypothetical protein
VLHASYVFPFFAFSALNFAHRAFVAFEIFALAAADMTCFFTAVTSRAVEPPRAIAAANGTHYKTFFEWLYDRDKIRAPKLFNEDKKDS